MTSELPGQEKVERVADLTATFQVHQHQEKNLVQWEESLKSKD